MDSCQQPRRRGERWRTIGPDAIGRVPARMSAACRICGNDRDNTPHVVREMMFGTRQAFAYLRCSACGCLQIGELPGSQDAQYPPGYCAFRSRWRLARGCLRAHLDRARVAQAYGMRSFTGWLAGRIAGPLDYVHWLQTAGLGPDAEVLDIGCGHGKVLLRMRLGGLPRCVGVDPYIDADIHYPNGVVIHKSELADFAQSRPPRFDLVMLHHSLEHMPQQQAALRQAAHLLNRNGCVLVRIPLAEGEAWERYREDWVQLDAPRHLYLHTRRSLDCLAAQADLRVIKVQYDSTALQFQGSELYRRGIALTADARRKAVFSRATLRHFATEAARLNATGRGDQAIFWLKPHQAAERTQHRYPF